MPRLELLLVPFANVNCVGAASDQPFHAPVVQPSRPISSVVPRLRPTTSGHHRIGAAPWQGHGIEVRVVSAGGVADLQQGRWDGLVWIGANHVQGGRTASIALPLVRDRH